MPGIFIYSPNPPDVVGAVTPVASEVISLLLVRILHHWFCTTLWNSLCFLIASSFAGQERFGGKVFWKRWCFISRSALISLQFSANKSWHFLLWIPKVLHAIESTLTFEFSNVFASSSSIKLIALTKIDFVSGECNFDTSSCFGRGKALCLTFEWILSANLALTRRWSVQQSSPLLIRTLWRSRRRAMILSIICQCLERGCCHIPLYLFFGRNHVSNHKIMLFTKL